jgi:poly-gamma-glutamate synthesis protein (capsule biosynthesis protein)
VKKFSVGIAGAVLAGCLLLSGCSAITGFWHSSNKAKEASEKGASGNAVVKMKEIMADLDDLVEICLNQTEKDNSAGYPLDESFYLWFYHRYGETVFRKLADSLSQGCDQRIYSRLTGNSIHCLWDYYCLDTGLNPEELNNVCIMRGKSSTGVTMNFAGDINFDENWKSVRYADRKGINISECFTNGLLDEMKNVDIMFLNNECTYGNKGTPLPGKAFTFQGKTTRAWNLLALGVDGVSLANNHVYDYGREGLLSTIETLDKIRMPHVGAGKNINEASQTLYYIVNGKKIAITAATQIERTYRYTKEATENEPGVLKCQVPDKYVQVIKEAKKKADYVIAFVHWGTEGKVFFEKDQVDLGRIFANAGADVVIGGHTHCLQGMEFYNGVPVFYSMGNFWFDWDVENSKATGMLQIVISEKGRIKYRFIPCYYDKYKTRLITNKKEKQKAYRYYERLSWEMYIDKNGFVHSKE